MVNEVIITVLYNPISDTGNHTKFGKLEVLGLTVGIIAVAVVVVAIFELVVCLQRRRHRRQMSTETATKTPSK